MTLPPNNPHNGDTVQLCDWCKPFGLCGTVSGPPNRARCDRCFGPMDAPAHQVLEFPSQHAVPKPVLVTSAGDNVVMFRPRPARQEGWHAPAEPHLLRLAPDDRDWGGTSDGSMLDPSCDGSML